MNSSRALLILMCVACALAGFDFDAFRMLQYNEDDVSLGSRRTRVDYLATPPSASESFARKVILMKMEEVSVDLVKTLSVKENVDAMLILLPTDLESKIDSDTHARWVDVESELMKTEVLIPVYFAFEDARLARVYDQMMSSVGADGTQFVVTDSEATPLKDMKYQNVQGWLTSDSGDSDDGSMPSLLLVAHYDTSAIAPDLAVGVDSNGSGVVAILELARLFSRLFVSSGPSLSHSHNLLFLLTAGGYHNFEGARHWLSDAPPRLLDSVDFALCLDSLGAASDDLFLHATKLPKDPKLAKLHELIISSGSSYETVVDTVYKKVNGSAEQMRWEHEPFAKRKIPAATLSARSVPHSHFTQGSLLDRRSTASDEHVVRNIAIVAEAVAHFIFSLPSESTIFQGTLSPQPAFVSAWLDHLSHTPRTQPFVSSNTTDSLASVFEDHGLSVSRQVFASDPRLTWFGTMKVKMSAYRVKAFLFDLFLALGIAAYLMVLNLGLQAL